MAAPVNKEKCPPRLFVIFRYLPDSVRRYPPPEAIAEHMRAVGLAGVGWRRLTLGLVTLHAGRRV